MRSPCQVACSRNQYPPAPSLTNTIRTRVTLQHTQLNLLPFSLDVHVHSWKISASVICAGLLILLEPKIIDTTHLKNKTIRLQESKTRGFPYTYPRKVSSDRTLDFLADFSPSSSTYNTYYLLRPGGLSVDH